MTYSRRLPVAEVGDRPVSPLLEFDDAPRAFIEPSEQTRARDVPAACVITFFGDSFQRRRAQPDAKVISENRWEDGPHPLIEVEHEGERLAILHSGVGAPLAGGLLEEAIATGCRAFVMCGGAGALRSDLTVGKLIVPDSAIRDEGTSHHYAPAAWTIDLGSTALLAVTGTLDDTGTPHVVGRTWTTDAPYRETPGKIAARRDEGCLTVEMEVSALAAVAAFRGVPFGAILYAGDDLSGEHWDRRQWQHKADVRDELLSLAGSAALRLASGLG